MNSLLRTIPIFFLTFYSIQVYSLSNTQILEICKKEINKKSCIKELKTKRSELEEGIPIEIEVIPYNNN